jgi:uncharacterized protein with HEPN domain
VTQQSGRAADKIVGDLLDAADAAAEIVARGKDAWQRDRLLRLAGEAVISRIGDAAAKLPDDVRAAIPSVPWEDIRANRVLVAHIYHGSTMRSCGRPLHAMCQRSRPKSRRGVPLRYNTALRASPSNRRIRAASAAVTPSSHHAKIRNLCGQAAQSPRKCRYLRSSEPWSAAAMNGLRRLKRDQPHGCLSVNSNGLHDRDSRYLAKAVTPDGPGNGTRHQ